MLDAPGWRDHPLRRNRPPGAMARRLADLVEPRLLDAGPESGNRYRGRVRCADKEIGRLRLDGRLAR